MSTNSLSLSLVPKTIVYPYVPKSIGLLEPQIIIASSFPSLSTSPSKEAFNLRAQSLTEIGKTRDAISDYAMSLDLDPKQPDVYFSRAKLRLSIGDMEGACYDWKHAYELGHRDAADMLYKYCK